jgi:hypothetical protein
MASFLPLCLGQVLTKPSKFFCANVHVLLWEVHHPISRIPGSFKAHTLSMQIEKVGNCFPEHAAAKKYNFIQLATMTVVCW